MLWRISFLTLCFVMQFRLKDRVSSQTPTVYPYPPTRADFAVSTLSPEEKEMFIDEHNKLRGMVDPPAADMNYLVRL